MTRNRFRLGHKTVGPFRINFGKTGKLGVSSVSLDTGIVNFRLWSANGQRGVSSIDTPGWGSIRRDLPTTKQKQARTDQDQAPSTLQAQREQIRRNAQAQANTERQGRTYSN